MCEREKLFNMDGIEEKNHETIDNPLYKLRNLCDRAMDDPDDFISPGSLSLFLYMIEIHYCISNDGQTETKPRSPCFRFLFDYSWDFTLSPDGEICISLVQDNNESMAGIDIVLHDNGKTATVLMKDKDDNYCQENSVHCIDLDRIVETFINEME